MLKKILTSLVFVFTQTMFLNGQTVVFWSEDFNNGCTDNCLASSYTSVNGVWTVSLPGTNGNIANEWFISCSENGEPSGSCGAGCGSNATLHVGSVPCTLCLLCPSGDCGATYNAGPVFFGEDPTTDKRVESPLINTVGKTNINFSFKYIENGQGTTDDATVEYSVDGGATWLLLSNPAKTAICANSQGTWTDYSNLLPASCENITNLKIAFRWKNNSNVGTDPSFAVDDVELSVQTGSLPVAIFSASDSVLCEKSCINFNDLSTNSPTSWAWSLPGGQPDTSNLQNPTQVCYQNYGTYPVTLTVSNASGSNSVTYTSFITVHPEPAQPVISQSNDTLICSYAFSYQWYSGITPVTGAISQTFVPSQPGQYFCLITDSNDCSSGSNVIVITSLLSLNSNETIELFYNQSTEDVLIIAKDLNGNYNATIMLTDALGRLLKTSNFVLTGNSVKSFSIKENATGMYLLRLLIGDKEVNKRIFKWKL